MPSFEHKELIKRIAQLDQVPEEAEAYTDWIEAGGHLAFLRENARANELAHLILPSSMHYLLPEDVQERLADWFAGALLLPASSLRDQLGRKRKTLSWYELAEIKEQFGASYQAITYRCRQAGIITRETFRDLFDEYRRLGWREAPYQEHHALSPERESSTRLVRLALRGITEGILSQSEATMFLNTSEEELVRWMRPLNA